MQEAGRQGGRSRGFSNLLLHLHPRSVPAGALRLDRTWGLGGAAAVLFLLLAATGALLLLLYEPSPERAHAAVARIASEVPFGALIRNAHHWGGAALVAVTVLHLLRVVYRGGHVPPRAGNWAVGVAILLAVVASAFTGYLLPWDQLAYWAVTVATGMLGYVPGVGAALVRGVRGGAEVGAPTLARFFVLHVAVLPGLLVVLLSLHFWRVRKVGGVVLPAGESRGPAVPSSPDLTAREGAAALVTAAAVALLSAVADAPLLAPANPGASPNPAKAPWYFMGLQEVLVHVEPVLGAVVLPVLALGALLALPALSGTEPSTGAWFGSPRGARHCLVAAVTALLATGAAVAAAEFLRRAARAGAGALRPGPAPAIAALLLVLLAAWLSRRRGATRSEAVQSAFTFAAVSLAVLTAVGSLLRGPGMDLTWP